MKRTVAVLGPVPHAIHRLGWTLATTNVCDVLWVTDPMQAKKIADFRYRLLVFREPRSLSPEQEAGALILRFVADLILYFDSYRRFDRHDQLVDEIIDEILEVF